MFCRHNRLEANCPICQREKAEARGPVSSSRRTGSSTPRRTGTAAPASGARRGAGTRGAGRLVTKRLVRSAEDGYTTPLAMGVRSSADAERLATAFALAAARLEPPGPHPFLAEAADAEEAHWLAFLLAIAGPDRPELQAALIAARPPWDSGDDSGLGPEHGATIGAYRAWVTRHGETQAAAVRGVESWTPSKRFARTFDRLSLPGFGRAARFEFLHALGAAGLQDVEADALHVAVGRDDATTLGAKRALGSGDAMLLERRAADLAAGTGVPIGALDRGLALWDRPGTLPAPDPERVEPIRAALKLA